MNIAFLYKFFPSVGGVERVMTVLANEFVKSGHRMTIYSFRQSLPAPFYFLDSCVILKNLPDTTRIDSPANAAFMAKEVTTYGIDVIVNHDSTWDSVNLCSDIKKRTKIKIVTLHHGQIYLPYKSLQTIASNFSASNPRRLFTPFYYLYDRIRRHRHHRYNISIMDKYVLLSDSFRQQLVNHRNEYKLEVIPNPLSFPTFIDMNQYHEKENIVLMVGRLSEAHKRFQMALTIWDIIEKQSKYDNWRLEIVGEGDARRDMEETIAKLGLKRVELIGNANSERYYRRAKIYFMTSAFEGFPLVLLEAMQNACVPIVMDSFETVHDLITDGHEGAIVANNDIDMFVANTQMLMDNKGKLEEMANKALQKSYSYAPEALSHRWLDLISHLCSDAVI